MGRKIIVTELNRNLMRINVATDPTLFNKNFLSLNLGTPDANERITCIFGREAGDNTYSNVPPAMASTTWIGTRYVIMRSTTQAIVKIDEMYPTAGRQWSNFYNNGTWSGWKVLTPA